jgi:hypothetical protein
MDRKKFLPLLFSSALMVFYACGEGEIFKATDDDEMMKSKSDNDSKNAISDYDFLQPYLEYCSGKDGKKKGCKAELVKSSSSQKDDSKSASSKSSSSVKSSSSSKGSTNKSSSSTKSSTSSSSSSKGKTSSSSGGKTSSSSKALEVSGNCVLEKPTVTRVGDDVIWRYVPDKGSLQEAEFEWDLNNETEKSLRSGDVRGTGTPEIMVRFTKKGKKYGPTLIFGGKSKDCENLYVYAEDEDPEASSSSGEESSSSNKARSSSSEAQSSSSEVPEGFCMASKREVMVGDPVEWFIVDEDGNELQGEYQWADIGADGTLISGELDGVGSTRIKVSYSTQGNKVPMAYWNGSNTVLCDNADDWLPWLVVNEPVQSSSSEETVEDSSSSDGGSQSESSSSSNDVPPVIDPPVI